jgi:hypothetical protein
MLQLVKVKVNFTLEQATKAQREREREEGESEGGESRGVAILFL